MDNAIKDRHVALEGVLIRNVTLPEAIQIAINDKLQAEQAALKMKFVIAEAEAEQQKQLMEVKAEAEREKIAAEAADAKRIDAQATDDYARIIQQHMTDKMLQWQRIEAMRELAASQNTKVIMTGDGKGTILDIK